MRGCSSLSMGLCIRAGCACASASACIRGSSPNGPQQPPPPQPCPSSGPSGARRPQSLCKPPNCWCSIPHCEHRKIPLSSADSTSAEAGLHRKLLEEYTGIHAFGAFRTGTEAISNMTFRSLKAMCMLVWTSPFLAYFKQLLVPANAVKTGAIVNLHFRSSTLKCL